MSGDVAGLKSERWQVWCGRDTYAGAGCARGRGVGHFVVVCVLIDVECVGGALGRLARMTGFDGVCGR